MDIIMPIILFSVGGMMMLFAYLIGVRKMYNLISGINTATSEQKVKMDLPAICRAMGIGFVIIGTVFLIAGGLSSTGISWAPIVAFAILFAAIWIMIIYIQNKYRQIRNNRNCPYRTAGFFQCENEW